MRLELTWLQGCVGSDRARLTLHQIELLPFLEGDGAGEALVDPGDESDDVPPCTAVVVWPRCGDHTAKQQADPRGAFQVAVQEVFEGEQLEWHPLQAFEYVNGDEHLPYRGAWDVPLPY